MTDFDYTQDEVELGLELFKIYSDKYKSYCAAFGDWNSLSPNHRKVFIETAIEWATNHKITAELLSAAFDYSDNQHEYPLGNFGLSEDELLKFVLDTEFGEIDRKSCIVGIGIGVMAARHTPCYEHK